MSWLVWTIFKMHAQINYFTLRLGASLLRTMKGSRTSCYNPLEDEFFVLVKSLLDSCLRESKHMSVRSKCSPPLNDDISYIILLDTTGQIISQVAIVLSMLIPQVSLIFCKIEIIWSLIFFSLMISKKLFKNCIRFTSFKLLLWMYIFVICSMEIFSNMLLILDW